MSKYGLHGRLTASPGNSEKLADILLAAAKLVASAPGCQVYLVSKDPEHPDTVWVTEVWDRKEDHDKSLQVAGVRELIARAMPILQGAPQKGQELAILGGTAFNQPIAG